MASAGWSDAAPTATTDRQCRDKVAGCMDPEACNYDATANSDDGTCTYAAQYYDCAGNCLNDTDGDGICDELEIAGCTDPTATNYDATATDDDGSCTYCVYGCTDPTQFNYDANATCDDGSCQPFTYGCTDPNAANYNANVNTDDGSCIYFGCTDPAADNYDASANTDDGSCTYSNTCAGADITGLGTAGVIHDRATFLFDNPNTYDATTGAMICRTDQIRIKYRVVGTSSWSQKNLASPTGYDANGLCNTTYNTSKNVFGLTPSSTYEWEAKVWYCDGQTTGWVQGPQFTTLDACPNVGNLAVTTPTTTKATFTWDDSNRQQSLNNELIRIMNVFLGAGQEAQSRWAETYGAGPSTTTFDKAHLHNMGFENLLSPPLMSPGRLEQHPFYNAWCNHSDSNIPSWLNSSKDFYENLRFMVFKVKQRAAKDYERYRSKQIHHVLRKRYISDLSQASPSEQKSILGENVIENITYSEVYGANWPYDYFSLIETIKLDVNFEVIG